MTAPNHSTRGHRGLVAVTGVIGVALLAWLAIVALARHSANARIEAELALARAAGLFETHAARPRPIERPSPAVERLVSSIDRVDEVGGPFVATGLWTSLCAHDTEFVRRAALAAGDAQLDPAAYAQQLVALHGRLPPVVDDVCLRAAFAAWARRAHDEIAICRAAVDGDLHAFCPGDGRFIEIARATAGVLARSAVAAGLDGDGAAARADLARVLALCAQLVDVTEFVAVVARGGPRAHVDAALELLLSRSDAARELRELDAVLGAIDGEAVSASGFRGEHAHFVELAADPSLRWNIGPRTLARFSGGRLWAWPSAELGVADALEVWREGETFFGRPLHVVRAEAAFAAYLARADQQPGYFVGAEYVQRELSRAAIERARTTLARAALRARFESFEAAASFLATQLDPFTGGTIFSRVEANGSWVAWCSKSLDSAAGATGPDADRDVVWRLPAR